MPSDPLTRLAIAMASDPGVYALLIGSGVSTGAGVPTGWGVQVALMADVARAESASVDYDDGDALAAWWREAHGADPTYSALLEELSATPHERQAQLRSYFLPSEDERRQGLKIPGPAHDGIARLVANGAVRLILTTNFDSLIEQALSAHNIDFDVWSSADEITGGIPLSHGRNVVAKLHGDYRRSDLRNTVSELSEYPDVINTLLDRIFDEFGIVVCGWSAEYDVALRRAVERATSRRYSWWWAEREDALQGHAHSLAHHRRAIVIPGKDADHFFTELAERHAAVTSRAVPDATQTAVILDVTAQQAADPSQRTRLTEQLLGGAASVRDALSDPDRFPPLNPRLSAEDAVARSTALVEVVRQLTQQVAQTVANADTDIAFDIVSRVLEVLADVDRNRWFTDLPLLVVWYGTGIMAVDQDRPKMLRRFATELQLTRDLGVGREPLVAALHPWRVFDRNMRLAQWLAWGGPYDRDKYSPISQWLEHVLRDLLDPFPVTATEDRWELTFDRFEWVAGVLLASLAIGSPGTGVLPPHGGNFTWREKYRYQVGDRWDELSEWVTDRIEVLLPDQSDEQREEVLQDHARVMTGIFANHRL